VAVQQGLANLVANRSFAGLVNTVKSQFGAQLTSFQSSLLDAADLIIQNADLIAPGALTPSQMARVPAFASGLQANPAVVELHLAGDATRTVAAGVPCGYVSFANGAYPLDLARPALPGSIAGQIAALTQSTSFANLMSIGNVALQDPQKAGALQTMSGLVLAATLPASTIAALSLSGSVIPTGFDLGTFLTGAVGVIGGIVVGAATAVGCISCADGLYVCDPEGFVWAGALIAGGAGLVYASLHCIGNGSASCQGDNDCPTGSSCDSACCVDSTGHTVSALFLTGPSCGSLRLACPIAIAGRAWVGRAAAAPTRSRPAPATAAASMRTAPAATPVRPAAAPARAASPASSASPCRWERAAPRGPCARPETAVRWAAALHRRSRRPSNP
jgi:hypothetical protein